MLLTIKKADRLAHDIKFGDRIEIKVEDGIAYLSKSDTGVSVSNAGQIVISRSIREALCLTSAQQLVIYSSGSRLILCESQRLEAEAAIERARREIAASFEVGTGQNNFLARVKMVDGKVQNLIINTDESMFIITKALERDPDIYDIIYIVPADQYKVM